MPASSPVCGGHRTSGDGSRIVTGNLCSEENEHPQFSLHNPKVPTFENLLNPIRNVTSRADHIKGFRFEINIPLSNYFQLSHTWNIPNSGEAASKNPMKPPEKPTYTLSAQLVRHIVQNDPQTILSARMDNDGKLEAFFIKRLASNMSLRLTSMFLNSNVEYGMLAADLDIESNLVSYGRRQFDHWSQADQRGVQLQPYGEDYS